MFTECAVRDRGRRGVGGGFVSLGRRSGKGSNDEDWRQNLPRFWLGPCCGVSDTTGDLGQDQAEIARPVSPGSLGCRAELAESVFHNARQHFRQILEGSGAGQPLCRAGRRARDQGQTRRV